MEDEFMPSMNIVSILSYLVDFVQCIFTKSAGFCNSAKSRHCRLCKFTSLFSTLLSIDTKTAILTVKTHAQFLAIHGKRGALGGVMDGQHAIQPPSHALVQADGAGVGAEHA